MDRPPRSNGWEDFWADEDSFLPTDEFKDYAAMIEVIVQRAKEPLGTRQIHDKLGKDRVRREWTLDALESLKSVEKIEGLIDRWQFKQGIEPVHKKRWNGDNMSWLFSRSAYGRGPKFANLGVTEPSKNSF